MAYLNQIKKFYEEIKYFKQTQIILHTSCKDSTGNVILQIEDVLKRWKEYFCNILKPPTISYRINMTTTHISSQDEVDPPTYNEICSVINKLKITKAAGTDNTLAELIRYGGRTLKKKMHKLMLNIWNNERLPAQWNEGIICPIYEKCDRLNCSNYRPITLLNIAYKIFTILLNRLTDIIEKLGEYQIGFRPNRYTIDNIFIVRQVFEQCHVMMGGIMFNCFCYIYLYTFV
jgi:hypothetical protein